MAPENQEWLRADIEAIKSKLTQIEDKMTKVSLSYSKHEVEIGQLKLDMKTVKNIGVFVITSVIAITLTLLLKR